MIKFKIILATALAPFLVLSQQDSTAVRISKFVTANGMKENLTVLASDEYEGRETGMKGQKMSAEYISTYFKKLGIPPVQESYFQKFDLILHKPQEVKLSVNGKTFKQGEDFYSPSAVSKDSTIDLSQLVFAGHGVNTEKYNDYKELKEGFEMAMILTADPLDKEKNSIITGTKEMSDWTSNWRMKNAEAKKNGVKILFIVEDDLQKSLQSNSHRITSPRMSLMEDYKPGTPGDGMLIIHINKKIADELLAKSKKNISSITKKISRKKQPDNFSFESKVTLTVKQTHENLTGENVLGYIEGTDLKNELIVVTAHYDHLGKHDGVVYNGADDDGSGTVGVMELAKAFATAKKQGKGPRRSMLFMTVAGEEKGLLGSDYYSRHPVFPLESTVADLNIDMIGRLDKAHASNPNYIYIIGSNMLSSSLHKINEESNSKYVNLQLDYTYNTTTDPNRYYYRSDHYNFAKNNIPVIFYFNGVHEDYHKETDEVQKIDFNKMEKIARLVFFTAWELANRSERIKVDGKNR
jgi:hypothetical protein